MYSDGYLEAADTLVEHLLQKPVPPKLEYPIRYLYRHGMELALKELILEAHRALRLMERVGAAEAWAERARQLSQEYRSLKRKHRLLPLFDHALTCLCLLDEKDPSSVLPPPSDDDHVDRSRLLDMVHPPPRVRATIERLDEADPTGETLRYGYSLDGEVLPRKWREDLEQLRKDVREAQRWFTAAADYAVFAGDELGDYLEELEEFE